MLAVVEGLAAHFEERHQDVMRWPWKLFCAKWVRLLEAQRTRKIEGRKREDARGQEELAHKHRELYG